MIYINYIYLYIFFQYFLLLSFGIFGIFSKCIWKKVSNYTKGGTYRVFFIDFEGKYGEKGTVYLKADNAERIKLAGAPNRNIEGENEIINTTTYEPTEEAIAMMKKQNPGWGKKRWNSRPKK